jgi:hypothetical protein
MFIEILLGIIIAGIILYLIFLYIRWADEYNAKADMYKYIPSGVSADDVKTLSRYGWLLPPKVLSDTHKYINFWVKYYKLKFITQI